MKKKIIKSDAYAILFPKVLVAIFINLIVILVCYYLFLYLKQNVFSIFIYLIFLIPFLTIYSFMIRIEFYFFPVLFTKYKFYEDHIEKEFKFIKHKATSVSYSQINDIKIVRSLYDRIFRVGDVLIFTGIDSHLEDSNRKSCTMKIHKIQNPEKVRNFLMSRIKS